MRVQEVLRKYARQHTQTLKEFWIIGSCTQYCYRKNKALRYRNDVLVPRLCVKQY